MKKIILGLLLFTLFSAGCNTNQTLYETQNTTCSPIALKLEQSYLDSYNKVAIAESSFVGNIDLNAKNSQPTTLMRSMPYSLDKVNIYYTSDLNSYLGKKVSIKGKLNKFELEGQTVTEIWPSSVCVFN